MPQDSQHRAALSRFLGVFMDFVPGELLNAVSVLQPAVVFDWASKPGTKVTVLSKQSADAASPAGLWQCVG